MTVLQVLRACHERVCLHAGFPHRSEHQGPQLCTRQQPTGSRLLTRPAGIHASGGGCQCEAQSSTHSIRLCPPRAAGTAVSCLLISSEAAATVATSCKAVLCVHTARNHPSASLSKPCCYLLSSPQSCMLHNHQGVTSLLPLLAGKAVPGLRTAEQGSWHISNRPGACCI